MLPTTLKSYPAMFTPPRKGIVLVGVDPGLVAVVVAVVVAVAVPGKHWE